VTTCFQIFRIYAQNVQNGLDIADTENTADRGINDQLINITALIHE